MQLQDLLSYLSVLIAQRGTTTKTPTDVNRSRFTKIGALIQSYTQVTGTQAVPSLPSRLCVASTNSSPDSCPKGRLTDFSMVSFSEQMAGLQGSRQQR